MPERGDHSPAEEKAEPASTLFSPVARDYPSRVFSVFFSGSRLSWCFIPRKRLPPYIGITTIRRLACSCVPPQGDNLHDVVQEC
jgi:hypothetical protein